MLRIKNWHENFETERTATFKCRLQIDIKTEYSGFKVRRLLKDPNDGGWHFAVWILLLQWHARTEPPREGWLTHNGKPNGIELTAEDIAEEINIPVNHVSKALERLSSPPIEWVENITVERSVYAEDAQSGRSDKGALPTPSKAKPKAKPNTYTPEFESLWCIHRKGGKIKAFEAFKKLNPDAETLAVWIEKLKAFKKCEAWTKEGEKYAPQLSKWLNQGYFDGDVPLEGESPTDFVKRTYPEEEWGEEPTA